MSLRYDQAVAIEAALQQANAAATTLATYATLAHTLAERAGLSTNDPDGGRHGWAPALKLYALKMENAASLTATVMADFDALLAAEGDELAKARVQAREAQERQ